MKKAALLSLLMTTCLACDEAGNPVASSVSQPVVVAAAAAPSPSQPVPAVPADAVEGATCKESFRMVPLNFQKQSGALPEVLKVRFERLVPLSQEVHVATFDTSHNSAAAGRQRGLQVRSTRLGSERGSTAQLDIPIDCGMTLQVDFGCGADAPPGAAYDGGSYNSHVVGSRACSQAPDSIVPAGVPTPAPTPTPTPAPEETTAPAAPVSCPQIILSVVDLGSQNGQARLEIRTVRPSAREIVVVATPEESGAVLQTTVPRAGGTATLTAPAPQRWYGITVSAFADDGQRCEVKLRICF